MKCALIIPSWLPEELFPAKTAGSQINYWQPLGTLYVAASLKQAGHRVQFYNGAFMQHRDILQQIREFCPEFVGLYSTTFGWDKAVRTAQDIKAIDPAIFTCVGGPFPIAVQKQCLLNVGPSEGLSEGPNERTSDGQCFNAVVTGEGEITVTEMVNRIVRAAGLEPPRLKVPYRIAKTGGLAVERLWDRTEREDDPPMTSFLAEQLATAHWFDQRETRSALQWEPAVTLETGFDRLRQWFSAKKY